MKYLLAFLFCVFVLTSCKDNATKEVTVLNETPEETKEEPPIDSIYNKLTKDFVLGKFNYRTHSDFTKAEASHSAKTLYVNTEVYSAFKTMYNAAKNDGINLNIISGTRNFEEQKAIWERKWNTYNDLSPKARALKILTYSSMPSTSRHHWGTDIDLNSLSNSYFSSGKGKAEYDWLVNNANTFGFYQVYTTKDNGRTGYNLEKWHWSYLPLASKFLKFYNDSITLDDINTFKGYELAKDLNVIEDYVNGIDEKAKNYR